MNNYNFKLQKVLDFKEVVEDTKKTDFNKARVVLDREQSRLNEILHQKELAYKKRNQEVSSTTIKDLKSYGFFIKSIDNRFKAQKERVAIQNSEVEKAKNHLIMATREKKVLQKLKEMDYEEYLYEEKKEEDKLVDQIVSFKSCMKQW